MNWLRRALARARELLRFLMQRHVDVQSARPASESPPPRPTSPPDIGDTTPAEERVMKVQPQSADGSAQKSFTHDASVLVLERVHESYVPVQRQAIYAVFRKLDIPYVPALFLSLLRRYDARSALFHFCELWAVSYDL